MSPQRSLVAELWTKITIHDIAAKMYVSTADKQHAVRAAVINHDFLYERGS